VGSSAVFEWACELLARESSMTAQQARGTIRLVLADAGLTPQTLSARQLRVVANKLLVKELKARHVDGADAICARLADCPLAPAGADEDATESIFRRLGRDD
jgi:hypothetical protein